MKNFILVVSFLFVFSAQANSDATTEAKGYVAPSDAEISASRACFEELARLGCRTQEEDSEQFRVCLSETQSSLDEYCKKMMVDLYGN